MKTDIKSIAIAMDIYVILYATIATTLGINSNIPTAPNWNSIVNWPSSLNTAGHVIPVGWSFSILSATIHLGYILIPFQYIVGAILFSISILNYFVSGMYFLILLFTFPTNNLPFPINNMLNLLFGTIAILSILLSIKIVYSGFD